MLQAAVMRVGGGRASIALIASTEQRSRPPEHNFYPIAVDAPGWHKCRKVLFYIVGERPMRARQQEDRQKSEKHRVDLVNRD